MSFRIALLQNLITETHLKRFASKRILDAGCGGGGFENLISEIGITGSVVGIDIEERAIKRLAKIFPQYSFFNSSLLEKLPFASGEFDTAVMFDVIEHLPGGSEVSALTELNRVMKRGGWLFVTTAHHTFLNFLDPAWYFGHRHYSEDKLSYLVTRSGFIVKEVNLIGDLWWELDTILLYVCKYIFKRDYSNSLRRHFSKADHFGDKGTRLCLVAQKS